MPAISAQGLPRFARAADSLRPVRAMGPGSGLHRAPSAARASEVGASGKSRRGCGHPSIPGSHPRARTPRPRRSRRPSQSSLNPPSRIPRRPAPGHLASSVSSPPPSVSASRRSPVWPDAAGRKRVSPASRARTRPRVAPVLRERFSRRSIEAGAARKSGCAGKAITALAATREEDLAAPRRNRTRGMGQEASPLVQGRTGCYTEGRSCGSGPGRVPRTAGQRPIRP